MSRERALDADGPRARPQSKPVSEVIFQFVEMMSNFVGVSAGIKIRRPPQEAVINQAGEPVPPQQFWQIDEE